MPHTPSSDVLRRFGVALSQCLGERENTTWHVNDGVRNYVLRGHPSATSTGLDFEYAVMQDARSLGWPVPRLLAGPVHDGTFVWTLTEFLPGVPLARTTEGDRARGVLLAQLHADLRSCQRRYQRPGFLGCVELLFDERNDQALRRLASYFPDEAYVFSWHLDAAREQVLSLRTSDLDKQVIHGDFTPWNLLYSEGRVSGVLDFETTHVDLRIADFALAWRGKHDAVIDGYRSAGELSELEMALITPIFWAWMLIGVPAEVDRMVKGAVAPHAFVWQVRHLLRRTHYITIRDLPSGVRGLT